MVSSSLRIPELVSPRRWNLLSPTSLSFQQSLENELGLMMEHFPEAHPKDLKRFLMGNGMKADKAIPAYEAHLKWRSENLPVIKETCINELKKGRFFFYGKDKEGRPVAYYTLSVHDPKNRDLNEIFRMMTYQVEQVLETMPEETKGFTIVWDTRKTGVKNTDNEFLREFLTYFRAQYPEVLAQLIVAPVGFFQRSFWAMASKFLDERRASRIKMVADMEGLLEYVDATELLASHGGANPWTFDPNNV